MNPPTHVLTVRLEIVGIRRGDEEMASKVARAVLEYTDTEEFRAGHAQDGSFVASNGISITKTCIEGRL